MINHALCLSFKLEILQGIHQPGDDYRMALYVQAATLDENTATYTPRGEVMGPGYTAGGRPLSGYRAGLDGSVAYLDWDDPLWPVASITARGALIYNYTKGNRAVGVIDLGQDYISTNGAFLVVLPEPTAKTALVRIS